MRRLHEMGAVLGDLIHRESSAGELVDEASGAPGVPCPDGALPIPPPPRDPGSPDHVGAAGAIRALLVRLTNRMAHPRSCA